MAGMAAKKGELLKPVEIIDRGFIRKYLGKHNDFDVVDFVHPGGLVGMFLAANSGRG
jgi:hypothetical protein